MKAHGGSPIRMFRVLRQRFASAMAINRKSVVAVLLSGGLDSAILAVDLLRDHDRVVPLYIRGGLRWEELELAAAKGFSRQSRTPGLEKLTVLEEPIADVYGPHWSTGAARVPDAGTPDEAVYLPGRNLLLTVKASVWCRLRQIGALALGCLGSNPFPDSTPAFFQDLESVLSRAGRRTQTDPALRPPAQDRRRPARQGPAAAPDVFVHRLPRGPPLRIVQQVCRAAEGLSRRRRSGHDSLLGLGRALHPPGWCATLKLH